MDIGVTYPQTDMEADPGAVRHFTQAVEQMGYTHILAYDHVIGANTDSRPGWDRPYSIDSQFHDPFNLFSFMAAVCDKLRFVTGILILPQRQTVLVAKQSACLDVLSNGRFRLGVGIGWNELEYQALGETWKGRGPRMEEQVDVLRALWSQRAVNFKGEHHFIPDMGLKPLPVQRPIPVWFGGGCDSPHLTTKQARESVMRRIARMADGWIPQAGPRERQRELLGQMREMVKEYGRDPAKFGVETAIVVNRDNSDTWADDVRFWREAGATHVVVNTFRDGLKGVDAHLTRLEEFRRAVPAK